MLNRENIEDLLARSGHVIGTDGEKIGSVGELYADDDTGEPTWVTVKTGLFGTSQSFVPVEGARAEGDDLVVPYTKDHVKDAPRVNVDGHLTPEEEDRLYTHYNRETRTYAEASSDVDLQGDADLNAGTPTAGLGRTPGDEAYGRAPGQEASGRARLRRYVTRTGNAQGAPLQGNDAYRQDGTGPVVEEDRRL